MIRRLAISASGLTLVLLAGTAYASQAAPSRPGGTASPPIAYVTNAKLHGEVTPINTATNVTGAPIPAGREPIAIALTPNGREAYVANYLSGNVTPINTVTSTAGLAIKVGALPKPSRSSRDRKPSRSRPTAAPPTSRWATPWSRSRRRPTSPENRSR
jgi:hypothetical protein